MNISSKLLLGAAALTLAACSNDDLLGDEEQKVDQVEIIKPEGDVAYLNVRINSPVAGSGSRAAGDYLDGDGDEIIVKNAYFYFYDENGNYVLESNSWIDGAQQPSDENIELKGTNTVILTGLTGKSYPNWVVTVLNRPAGFTPGATLAEMGAKLVDNYKNADGYFTMTTSSFFGSDNVDPVATAAAGSTVWNYFATHLNADNFYQDTPTHEPATNIVQIYVERLAVRVGVDASGITNVKGANTYDETVNGVTKSYPLYELKVSVAGNTNPDQTQPGTNPGQTGLAASKVYVALTGWELTSTAKQSNLMKDLSGWTDQTTFGGTDGWKTWNHPDYHRSYWGKSRTYGLAGADLDAALMVNNNGWENLSKVVGTVGIKSDRVYCLETTNVPANIIASGTTVSTSKTPSVLLRAVVCDENGTPLQLVNYRGVEYLKPDFVSKALDNIRRADAMAAYYTRAQVATDSEGNPIYKYTELGTVDVTVVAAGNGLGSVKLAAAEGKEFFKIKNEVEKTDDAGNKYVTYDADAVAVSTVNAFLASATAGESSKAVAKTDGAMFYTIPLNHLNAGAENEVVEGQYGLVRNHIYNLSITKIKSLGQGVFVPRTFEDQPPEIIIPDTPKDPTFYIESAINVLSWRVVSQQVEI